MITQTGHQDQTGAGEGKFFTSLSEFLQLFLNPILTYTNAKTRSAHRLFVKPGYYYCFGYFLLGAISHITMCKSVYILVELFS